MDERKEKQNRKVTLFAILLSLISLGVLVFGFIVVSSDKVVMLQSISNLYNKVNNMFDDDFLLLDKIASNTNVGINTKNTLTLGKDKYNINFNYLENSNDKFSTLDLAIIFGEDNLTTNLAFKDNKLYYLLKNIMPTYQYKDEEYPYKTYFKSLSENDYDKVLALLKEAADNAISNDKILKEKVTVKYDGKDKKVNKLTYNIDIKELESIILDFASSVKKDKELYKNINNLLDDGNLVDHLNRYLDEVKANNQDNIFSYSTYYFGFNKIVQYEFHSYIDNLSFTYIEDKNKESWSITNDDNTVLNVIIGDDKDSFTFSGNISYLASKLNIENEKIKDLLSKDFSGSYKNKNFELIIEDEIPIKINLSYYNALENKYSTSLKVYNIITEEDKKKDKEVFTLDSEIEFVFDKKIDVDLEDSVDYATLTEEEINTINENIANNPIYQILKENFLIEEND